MKKKYYLDTILLILMVIATIPAYSHIERALDLITFSLFLILSLVANWRFRKVLKNPALCKASLGENFQYLVMIIGKSLYLLYMTNFILAGEEIWTSLIFIIFMINLVGFLNMTYLATEGLVLSFSKVIDCSEVAEIETVKCYFDYFYCHVTLKNGNILKLNLSQNAINQCLKQQSSIIIKGEIKE